MNQWWQAFQYYFESDVLLRRWEYSFFLLTVLGIAVFTELAVVGWQNSSLARLLSFRRTNRWDLLSVLFSVSGIQKILTNLFFIGAIGYLVLSTKDLSWPLLESAPLWVRGALAVVTFDFLMYWNHRLRHESDWFWITHEYHHSSTQLTLFTDFRVHPLDYIVFFPTTLLVMRLFFPGDIQELWYVSWITFVPGLIAHSRVDTGFGWLGRYVIVSPRFHHLHHSKDQHKFKNYGHFFVFWDRFFGTYAEPSVSIHNISQGLEENIYEGAKPVQAFFDPVRRFYLFPFERVQSLTKRFRRS